MRPLTSRYTAAEAETDCTTQPAGFESVAERMEMDALSPNIAFPLNDLMEEICDLQVESAEGVNNWMCTVAESLMKYSAANWRMPFATDMMSS